MLPLLSVASTSEAGRDYDDAFDLDGDDFGFYFNGNDYEDYDFNCDYEDYDVDDDGYGMNIMMIMNGTMKMARLMML